MPVQSLSMLHFFLWAVRIILVLCLTQTVQGLSICLHTNLHCTQWGKYMRVWQKRRLFHAFFMREISIKWNNSVSQTLCQQMTRKAVYIWIVQPEQLGFPTFQGFQPARSVNPLKKKSSIKKVNPLKKSAIKKKSFQNYLKTTYH